MATASKKTTTAAQTDDSTEGQRPDTARTYAVQWHIKTEGRRYAPGDTLDLTDDQAAPFLASGAITAAAPEAAA